MFKIFLMINLLSMASSCLGENYGILGAGPNFWWKSHNSDELEAGSEAGYLGYAAYGQKFANGYRVEVEVSYRRNNVHGINDPDNNFKSTGDGNVLTGIGLFANTAYDFSPGRFVQAYVVAGPGIMYLSVKDDGGAENPLNDETTTYGFQIGGGARFSINEQIRGDLGLRHMFTISTDLGGLNAEYDTTAITINLIANF